MSKFWQYVIAFGIVIVIIVGALVLSVWGEEAYWRRISSEHNLQYVGHELGGKYHNSIQYIYECSDCGEAFTSVIKR